jgi:hypothetical protein
MCLQHDYNPVTLKPIKVLQHMLPSLYMQCLCKNNQHLPLYIYKTAIGSSGFFGADKAYALPGSIPNAGPNNNDDDDDDDVDITKSGGGEDELEEQHKRKRKAEKEKQAKKKKSDFKF